MHNPLHLRGKTALIIGGGHNGLVCAWYLARAGLKVTVLERRGIVGGAAVTEEFHPGFRNSTASYTVSLLNPQISADMALAAHGLRIVERPLSNFLPLDENNHLILSPDLAATQAAVAKYSVKDAARLPEYYARLDVVADIVRDLVLETPPNQGDGLAMILAALKTGSRARALSLQGQRDALDLFTKSAREFLDGWFESAPIKAAFGFDAVVGNYASPDAPGSAYVLLHHCFGGVNGKKGVWGHAIGGMGAITQAMAQACLAAGVTLTLNAEIARVMVKNGAACGVQLADGREMRGDIIVSNLNPKLLFSELVAANDQPADFRARMQNYACGSGTFRMNVALRELPSFTCLPGQGDHLASGIIMAPSLDYMDAAYRSAKANGWSDAPIVEMLIPSLLDDSLAPPGQHVASLFCQHFAPVLPHGQRWSDVREQVADHIVASVTQHAPNFAASIIGRMILSPDDLEAKFGLTGGDIFHGRMSLDQLWAARPVLGHASYRAPVQNLYMCGSGTHPGGGVTGAPGHNCAREIVRDQSWFRRYRKFSA